MKRATCEMGRYGVVILGDIAIIDETASSKENRQKKNGRLRKQNGGLKEEQGKGKGSSLDEKEEVDNGGSAGSIRDSETFSNDFAMIFKATPRRRKRK